MHVHFPCFVHQFCFLKPGLTSPWNTSLWTEDTIHFLSQQWLLHLTSTRIRGREGGAQKQILTGLSQHKESKDFELLCTKKFHLRFHVLKRQLCPFSETRDNSSSSTEAMNNDTYLHLHYKITSYFQYLHQGRKHYPYHYKCMWFAVPHLVSWNKQFSWNREHYFPRVRNS